MFHLELFQHQFQILNLRFRSTIEDRSSTVVGTEEKNNRLEHSNYTGDLRSKQTPADTGKWSLSFETDLDKKFIKARYGSIRTLSEFIEF